MYLKGLKGYSILIMGHNKLKTLKILNFNGFTAVSAGYNGDKWILKKNSWNRFSKGAMVEISST